MISINVAVLLALNLITHGWELYINFLMPSRHALGNLYGSYALTGLEGAAVGLAFVIAVWASCAVALVGRRRQMTAHKGRLVNRLKGLLVAEDATGGRVLMLTIYVFVGSAAAIYCMRKQGTSGNEFTGVVWTLGLLAALGWRIAQRHAGTAAAAGGCVVVLFGLAQFGTVHPSRRESQRSGAAA